MNAPCSETRRAAGAAPEEDSGSEEAERASLDDNEKSPGGIAGLLNQAEEEQT